VHKNWWKYLWDRYKAVRTSILVACGRAKKRFPASTAAAMISSGIPWLLTYGLRCTKCDKENSNVNDSRKEELVGAWIATFNMKWYGTHRKRIRLYTEYSRQCQSRKYTSHIMNSKIPLGQAKPNLIDDVPNQTSSTPQINRFNSRHIHSGRWPE